MKPSHNVRRATQADVIAVRTISIETGLSDDADDQSALEPMDEDHTWIVFEDETGSIVGAAYFGPESHSDRVWNLYFLAVKAAHQSGGTGSALVHWVEENLRSRGADTAKLLLIETSSVDSFASTRTFYAKQGYTEVARVPDYYGPNDDKVVFWKALEENTRTSLA